MFESCLVSCRIYISRLNYSSASGLVADSCLRVSPACVVSCLADPNRLEDVMSLAVIRVTSLIKLKLHRNATCTFPFIVHASPGSTYHITRHLSST